jgi:hypothetical protein
METFAHPAFEKFCDRNAGGVVDAGLRAILTGLSCARIKGVKRRIYRIAVRRVLIRYRLRTSPLSIASKSLPDCLDPCGVKSACPVGRYRESRGKRRSLALLGMTGAQGTWLGAAVEGGKDAWLKPGATSVSRVVVIVGRLLGGSSRPWLCSRRARGGGGRRSRRRGGVGRGGRGRGGWRRSRLRCRNGRGCESID